MPTEERWFEAGKKRLEGRIVRPHAESTLDRAILLLHEGLGCVSAWRDFPEKVCARTGMPVIVYSRAGYGRSDGVELPRPLDYMQREGRNVVGAILDQCGVRDAMLVGHSDGGSIALAHSATADPHRRVRAMLLLAPHVICEEVSVRSIALAKHQYEEGDLREKLARHHGANVDVAFWGWNRAWLDPAFMQWSLEPLLPSVQAKVVVIQGADDPYGTLEQVARIEHGLNPDCQLRKVIIPKTGHAPWKERPEETLSEIERLADLRA